MRQSASEGVELCSAQLSNWLIRILDTIYVVHHNN